MADNGGAAFPIPGHIIANHPQTGMSLRDWFAGQALLALLGHPNTQGVEFAHQAAYIVADKMIAERKKER